MKNLEQIKDEVAKEFISTFTWDDLNYENEMRLWPEVCKRYATECIKASLEKAAQNVGSRCSLLHEENIVLL